MWAAEQLGRWLSAAGVVALGAVGANWTVVDAAAAQPDRGGIDFDDRMAVGLALHRAGGGAGGVLTGISNAPQVVRSRLWTTSLLTNASTAF
jgi:hypothetical protein